MTRQRLLAAATLLILMVPATAAAQDDGGGLDPNEWELAGGATVEAGTAVLPPDSAIFLRQAAALDRIDLQLEYRGPGISVVSYAMGDAGSHRVIVHEDGRIQLESGEGDPPTDLGWTDAPVTADDTRFTLTIDLTGGGHQISVDGRVVLTAETAAGGRGLEIMSAGERTLTVYGVTLATAAEEAPGEPVPGEAEPGGEEPAPTTTQPAVPAATSGSWLDDFFGLDATAIATGDIVINLALAALFAFILSRVYILWGAGLSNRRRFAANFMLITVTTTFIILVVRSSVALSLGLVGALSIVRFRAAIKDPEELAYLFLAIGIGIGLGDNQRLVTILALAVAIVIIGLLKVFRRREADFNLHVAVAAEGPRSVDLAAITAALQPFCTRLQLSRYDETPTGSEAAFLAEFAGPDELHAARDSLQRSVPGMSLTFLDNRGLV